jgi:hypothetical protein
VPSFPKAEKFFLFSSPHQKSGEYFSGVLMNADGIFVSCARRVWWQRSDYIAIPVVELSHWRAKFGTFMLGDLSGNWASVRISDLAPTAWGPLQCNCTVDSSAPTAIGPRRHDEHAASNRTVWGLFAGEALVYKSIRLKGCVVTVQSWYGHGEYDPAFPEISEQERLQTQYDPEFPDIELL